jgi:iron(III) transport system substrate-binding protein
MNRLISAALGSVGLAAVSLAFALPAQAADEVNIYSYRQPELMEPVLNAFSEKTGIKTNVVFLDKGLIERIAAEGKNSPVDLILTTDIARLQGAEDAGITAPVNDESIEQHIPAEYRDPDGNWFGLTMRGRVVYASKDRVEQDSITYEDLADPKWKGRICIRDGQHVYNIALFSSMIAHHGVEEAEKWMTALKNNLARKPTGNDRAQAKSIYAGECDIAIGNTYYVGLMITNDEQPEQKEWANSIKVIFPNKDGRGTHVNLSGMALAKYAPNRENAIKLMEFLASPAAQQVYAEQVFEYPVAPGTEISDIVKRFGELHPDSLSLSKIAEFAKEASKMVDRTGFNQGPNS